MEVYLDNSATTRVRQEVMDEVTDVNINCYGNPSSIHRMGLKTEKRIEEARKYVAKIINAKTDEIFFTGGGTESNNIALLGHLYGIEGKNNVVTTSIEHPSVYNVLKHFKDNVEIRYLKTDNFGRVNLEQLEDLIDENTLLVSIMHVNNELGIVQNLSEICKITKNKNKNTKIHVDAVQSYGKIKIDTNKIPADTISFSSHKIHGPKGVGGLFIRSGVKINPIIFGGGQEKNIRPGTENTPGIVGFGKACQLVYENFEEETTKLRNLKNLYAKRLTEEIKDTKINSTLSDDGAPHILNVSFKNVRGEVLVHFLEMKGVYVSTGSACSSRSKSNRILEAIQLDQDYVDGTIRISLGHFNNEDEVEYVVESIKQSVEEIRKIMKL
ncbi:MAG: cysteine desulfurase family protein [Sedimentibacter saalensis]|jgi:cysteine desulfurase|uniref:cysteine desulfurase family protein n=1 Tax=Sedimentibacter saalensis TaxID=130788 RepID=UPI002B213536|nr:cysteine desulfurase family protein [Sedimentibacter saalensis]MEA5095890.1 cysteine desulfurase family protein [Sedimentibacter saalensis]